MTTDLHALLAERYGHPGTPSSPVDDPIVRHLLTHRSVRAYTADPVPASALETMIAAAQSASTSSNLQTWSVVAVEDAARRERLSKLVNNQAHVRDCPLFLAWIADLSRLDAVGAATGRTPAALDYLEMFLMAAVDATLASQNAAVAAEAMGLGIVYIGGLRNHPEAVAEELGLPPRAFGVFGMCVGVPDPARPASIKPRLPVRTVLHRERYDAGRLAAEAAEYDATILRFFEGQGQKHAPWTKQSMDRVAGPQSMQGRDRLVEALHHLGFPLR